MNKIKYLNRNEILTKDEFIKAVMDRLQYLSSAAVHTEDENGNITNYCFYSINECDCPELMYESEFYGLSENGERYRRNVFEDEPITEEEIIKLLSDDSYYWSIGWYDVDCDL